MSHIFMCTVFTRDNSHIYLSIFISHLNIIILINFKTESSPLAKANVAKMTAAVQALSDDGGW